MLYNKVIDFLDKNYGAVVESGLMDDILIDEFKKNVQKLSEVHCNQADKLRIQQWVDFMLSQMVECASDNVSEGVTYPVFGEFLSIMQNSSVNKI